jgi:hypothetical protein
MSERPAFPGGQPRWNPPGDFFALIVAGVVAIAVIAVVCALRGPAGP